MTSAQSTSVIIRTRAIIGQQREEEEKRNGGDEKSGVPFIVALFFILRLYLQHYETACKDLSMPLDRTAQTAATLANVIICHDE
jgi:hypothetical protein